jgi:hypothetical protein
LLQLQNREVKKLLEELNKDEISSVGVDHNRIQKMPELIQIFEFSKKILSSSPKIDGFF